MAKKATKYTKEESECISNKIRHWKKQGRSQEAAIAAAIGTCAPSKSTGKGKK